MKKIYYLLFVLMLLTSCSSANNYQSISLEYKDAVELLQSQTEFDFSNKFSIEAYYHEVAKEFYVIVDNPIKELEDFKIVATSRSSDKTFATFPQSGFYDEENTLGINPIGIILTGETANDVQDIIIYCNYYLDDNFYEEFIIIKDVLKVV